IGRTMTGVAPVVALPPFCPVPVIVTARPTTRPSIDRSTTNGPPEGAAADVLEAVVAVVTVAVGAATSMMPFLKVTVGPAATVGTETGTPPANASDTLS